MSDDQRNGVAMREAMERRLAGLSPAKRALFLKQAGLGAGPVAATSIPRRADDGPAPLSFGQELLWLVEQANVGQGVYNVQTAVRVGGALDVDALQRAIDRLLARHALLRTRFALVGDVPAQVVDPAGRVEIERRDFRDEPGETRDADARAWLRGIARRSFDLAHDLPIRVAVARIADDEHWLVLTLHHLVSDGWSRGILYRELSALYEAATNDVDADLPPLAIQYADFAAWQRAQANGPETERQLAFWRAQVPSAPEPLALPYDYPKLNAHGFEGSRVGRTLSPELTTRIRALARAEGTSLFVTLMSAFQTLMHRYAGASDVVVASPVAGRAQSELEPIIGYFSNTLLFTARFDDDPTFRALLARGRETALAVFDHQDLPYERLVLDLAAGRRGGGAPLFTTMFSMAGGAGARLRLGDAEIGPLTGTTVGAAKTDLYVSANDSGDGLRLTAEYRVDLFEPATVERMLGHLETLLASAVADPETTVSRLGLLPDEERDLVLRAWNATAVDYPPDATLASLLAEQAARTPDAVAVVDDARSLTYAELDSASTALARRLREQGVAAGSLVGVSADRSVELVIALLATVKAGGAYVPFDPEYPTDRLTFMLEDAAVGVLLTTGRVNATLPPNRATKILLDGVADARDAGEPLPLPSPDDAAYMIYTSGSTGRPKGALNAHRGIVNRLLWMQQEYGLTPDDVVLQKTPFSFDVSVWEFFWPLIAGARLVMARPGGHRDPGYLASVLQQAGVTVCHFVPSMLRAFLADPAAGRASALRAVMASGEALPPDLVATFYRTLPSARLHNLYGPTECAVDVSYWPCPPTTKLLSVVPIGRPVANTQLYVLDAHGAPAPIGVPGELHLAGVQVGLGYHGRPELTAEKFVPVPPHLAMRESPAAKMYRTGDLARWRADGTVEYLGRLDFQVKVRGFRIELGEIETTLLRHEAIRDAVVVAREDASGEKQLVAYVVAAGEPTPAAELRRFLLETLPDYMVPAAFVYLSALPLSSNGKVDRRALPAPDAVGASETASSAVPYVEPLTALEHELVEIWERLLPVRPIGVQHDFFESGGHSLLALRMLIDIERVRGRRLPLASLLEHTTIASLASLLSGQVEEEGQQPLVVLNPNGTKLPLVFAHGDVHGGGWYCRRLAASIPDHPMVVLPTIHPDRPDAPATVETMAAHHIAELQKVRPHGPYLVGGFCAGGLVAYEIAQQLLARGEEVRLMVVADTAAQNAGFGVLEPLLRVAEKATAPRRRLDRRAVILRAARYYRDRLREAGDRSPAEQMRWLVQNVRRRVMSRRGVGPWPLNDTTVVRRRGAKEVRMASAQQDPWLPTLRFQNRASVAYIQKPFPGVLHAIWAADFREERRDRTRGWGQLVREFRVSEVSSSHIGLITRNLDAFGERLAEALAGVDP